MNVLVKPIITEKMTIMGEKSNRFGFIVDIKSSKLQIKKAVEEMYKVDVKSVNTMNYDGKLKSRSTKKAVIKGRQINRKKAIVSLSEGQVIDFFSNI